MEALGRQPRRLQPGYGHPDHRLGSLVVVAGAKKLRGDMPRVLGLAELKQSHGVVAEQHDATPDLSPEDFREIVEVVRLLHKWRLEAAP